MPFWRHFLAGSGRKRAETDGSGRKPGIAEVATNIGKTACRRPLKRSQVKKFKSLCRDSPRPRAPAPAQPASSSHRVRAPAARGGDRRERCRLGVLHRNPLTSACRVSWYRDQERRSGWWSRFMAPSPISRGSRLAPQRPAHGLGVRREHGVEAHADSQCIAPVRVHRMHEPRREDQ